jgi:hypothetical protein
MEYFHLGSDINVVYYIVLIFATLLLFIGFGDGAFPIGIILQHSQR